MRPSSIIFVSVLTVYMALGVLNPLLAPMVRALDLSETQGGLILTVAALLFSLSSPFWGPRTERFGRKTIFLVGLLGFSIGYWCFALAVEFGTSGVITPLVAFICMLITRGIAGFLMSAVPVSAQAYIAANTSGSERTAGIALLSSANALGFIIGPALGAGLAMVSLTAPLYAAAALPLVAALLVATQLRRTGIRVEAATPPRLSLRDARIWPWLAVGFIMIMCLVSMQATAGFLFQDRLGLTTQATAQMQGVALVILGLTNISLQFGVIRRLRVPPLRLLRIGLPIGMLGLAALALAHSFTALLASFVVAGAGIGLALPGLNAAVTLEVEPQEQGSTAGLSTMSLGMGAMAGPLIATSMYQLQSELPYFFTAVLLGLIALAAWLHPRLARVEQLATRRVVTP
ncbi:MAG TPA: MFS transporter [Roseiflexaceae bacterium]|nr:MFS transporter [Roseiflexaceae bacterium]HMP41346.1 MFS transporter [Roseiflexaceae bacterium]